MKKILVVEDDIEIQELLHDFLAGDGYQVTAVSDGVQAIAEFSKQPYDLLLLDIMLPKIDGYGVCELVRKQSHIPIMMLTALDGEGDQMKGFDLMIDDYITKPFSVPILLRKIAAVLRRADLDKGPEEFLQYKNLKMDLLAYQAFVDDIDVGLTPREFEIIRELLLHQGRILTRENLISLLWKYEFYGDERIVDTHIKNARKKLGAEWINTIRGVGYRVDKEI